MKTFKLLLLALLLPLLIISCDDIINSDENLKIVPDDDILSDVVFDFGDMEVGTIKNITNTEILKNETDVDIIVTSSFINGKDAEVFSLHLPENMKIPPGGECAVVVAAAPKELGIKEAMCVINIDGVDKEFSMRCLGVEKIEYDPIIDFGKIKPGETKTKVIEGFIKNETDVDIHINSAAVEGIDAPLFQIDLSDYVNEVVSPGQQFAFIGKASPASLDIKTATFIINIDGVDREYTLKCEGVDETTGPIFDLGFINAGDSFTNMFSIYSTGVTITSLNLTGGDISTFSFTSDPIPFTMENDNNFDMHFTAAPASLGFHKATGRLGMSNGDLDYTVVCYGTKPQGQLTMNNKYIDFGIVEIGVNKSISFKDFLLNETDVPVTIESVDLVFGSVKYFSFNHLSFPLVLSPGESLEMVFSAWAENAGIKRASAVIHTSDGDYTFDMRYDTE